MIKNFFSHYRPRYLRSLIYMLQASEYHVGEYLAWYWKVGNFGDVEKRKHLVKTKKATLLLALAALLAIVLIGLACSMFWFMPAPVNIVFFAIIILATPYFVAYGIVVPLYIAEIVIQKPLVFFALWQTKRVLAKHKALRIGIAGSFGKTSMREILKAVLSAGKKVAAPPESYNTPLGIAKFVKGLHGDEEILIFELGEYYPGDVQKLCRIIHPDWGFVTGVNEAHLEKFRTLDRTARTIFEISAFVDKERLYVNTESRTYLKTTPSAIVADCRKAEAQGRRRIRGYDDSRSNEGIAAIGPIPQGCGSFARSLRCFGKAVALLLSFPRAWRSGKRACNADRGSFEIGSLAEKYASPGNMLYSHRGVGDSRVMDAKTGLDGTSFTLIQDDSRLEMHSKLLGLHNVGPLAAAADIALQLGLSPAQVEEGIRKTAPFDHRLEPKIDASGVITLDDSYNGNPDGVGAVIDFLASLAGHRRFYVTPGLVEMGSRTGEVHREIGRELAAAGIEKTVLIKNSVTPYIEEGLREKKYQGEILWFDDALAAFAALPLMTVKGDVVILQNDWPDQYR